MHVTIQFSLTLSHALFLSITSAQLRAFEISDAYNQLYIRVPKQSRNCRWQLTGPFRVVQDNGCPADGYIFHAYQHPLYGIPCPCYPASPSSPAPSSQHPTWFTNCCQTPSLIRALFLLFISLIICAHFRRSHTLTHQLVVEHAVGVAWCRLHAKQLLLMGLLREGKSAPNGGSSTPGGIGNHAEIIKSTFGGRVKRVKCLKFVLIAIYRLSLVVYRSIVNRV